MQLKSEALFWQKGRTLDTVRRWMRSHVIITMVASLVVGVGIVLLVYTGPTYWEMASVRIIVSVIMLTVIILVGGLSVLRYKAGAISFSLRKSAYALILAFLPGLLTLFQLLNGSYEMVQDWTSVLIAVLALCIFVGIFEEALFRGIIFDGLLAKMGSTKAGIVWAMVLSSLIFGGVHVISFLLSGGPLTPSTVLQMILKIVQVAMIGFLFAAVYLKTRNLWSVAIVHCLNDFLTLAPVALLGGETSQVYATTGSTGDVYVIIYTVLIVLSLPFLRTAWNIVKKETPPAESIFTAK